MDHTTLSDMRTDLVVCIDLLCNAIGAAEDVLHAIVRPSFSLSSGTVSHVDSVGVVNVYQAARVRLRPLAYK